MRIQVIWDVKICHPRRFERSCRLYMTADTWRWWQAFESSGSTSSATQRHITENESSVIVSQQIDLTEDVSLCLYNQWHSHEMPSTKLNSLFIMECKTTYFTLKRPSSGWVWRIYASKKIKYNALYTSRDIAHLHLLVTSERWVRVVTMWFGGYKSSMYEA